MSKRTDLIDLIQHDPLGLLVDNEVKHKLHDQDFKLISMFEEIMEFFDENEREPESNISNIVEFKLFSRLKAIRSDPRKVRALKKFDFRNLLSGSDIQEVSLEDIIEDDPFELLSNEIDNDIFKLRHVKPSERISPDYLSRRKICEDFHLYKDMFNSLHDELSSKKRRLVRYSSVDLKTGKFFALDGILLYLKSVEGDVTNYGFKSGERERFDGRTLCIFDNGTQSDMLYRSLDKAMLIDGYSISDSLENVRNQEINDDSDVFNGYIYVLKSQHPKIRDINNLYKIGFTTGSVARRIINAKNEATYLFSEVTIVSTFRCFNMTTYDLEQTIHNFFSSVRLDLELHDNHGNYFKPREWFTVGIDIIEEAIYLITTNQINHYQYDPKINQILRKTDN